MIIKIKKIRSAAKLPTRSYDNALGYDLYACNDELIHVFKGEVKKIPTGIAVEPPPGYGFFIKERSGLGSTGVAVRAGVVDHSFTGEIMVLLHYLGNDYRYTVVSGDKVAQMVLIPTPTATIQEVQTLSKTKRGEKGFGSSDA